MYTHDFGIDSFPQQPIFCFLKKLSERSLLQTSSPPTSSTTTTTTTHAYELYCTLLLLLKYRINSACSSFFNRHVVDHEKKE